MVKLFKLFKKEEKEDIPQWAKLAKMADDFKQRVEQENDVTYLVAIKSVIDRLQKILEKKIQQLERSE